jgi:hypothetical protein
MTNKTFKHSGTTGDLIYSLPIVKYFGGGDFYLHLNQINWIGQHYYGSAPQGYHQGRMTTDDYKYLKDFMLYQDYISKFEPLDDTVGIHYNLDRFRKPFVGHPGNYVDLYAEVFGIKDPQQQKQLRITPWLTAPRDPKFEGKVIINRTGRWVPNEVNPHWAKWQGEGLDQNTLFIGHPEEYQQFKQHTGWTTEYLPCASLLEQATAINSAELFIGNQSAALAMAIGLGQHFWCEARRDLPAERNECYFHEQPKGHYF